MPRNLEDELGLRSLFLRKRRELNLSQTDMAVKYGVKRGIYTYWEQGMTPNLRHINKICKVLGVTPNEVFKWDVNAK